MTEKPTKQITYDFTGEEPGSIASVRDAIEYLVEAAIEYGEINPTPTLSDDSFSYEYGSCERIEHYYSIVFEKEDGRGHFSVSFISNDFINSDEIVEICAAIRKKPIKHSFVVSCYDPADCDDDEGEGRPFFIRRRKPGLPEHIDAEVIVDSIMGISQEQTDDGTFISTVVGGWYVSGQ